MIAKTVQNPDFGGAIRKEAQNTLYVWEKLSKDIKSAIPRPLCLDEIDDLPVYFEVATPGMAFPDMVAGCWLKKTKKKIIVKAVEEVSCWLSRFYIEMGVKTVCLQDVDIHDFFLKPIDAFVQRINLSGTERKAISDFKDMAKSLKGTNIKFVPEHGDFWGGSILLGTDGRLKIIDWEFFNPCNLPLQDFLNLAVHPGFVISNNKENGLLGEFMNLFSDSYFPEIIGSFFWEKVRFFGLDSAECVELIFALFLIKLSLDRDHNTKLKNSWRCLFSYFIENRSLCRLIKSSYSKR
ncbi:hypothetical protein JXL19_01520 [bacterium]|nr:hypothetical protein [bacterium]